MAVIVLLAHSAISPPPQRICHGLSKKIALTDRFEGGQVLLSGQMPQYRYGAHSAIMR